MNASIERTKRTGGMKRWHEGPRSKASAGMCAVLTHELTGQADYLLSVEQIVCLRSALVDSITICKSLPLPLPPLASAPLASLSFPSFTYSVDCSLSDRISAGAPPARSPQARGAVRGTAGGGRGWRMARALAGGGGGGCLKVA